MLSICSMKKSEYAMSRSETAIIAGDAADHCASSIETKTRAPARVRSARMNAWTSDLAAVHEVPLADWSRSGSFHDSGFGVPAPGRYSGRSHGG